MKESVALPEILPDKQDASVFAEVTLAMMLFIICLHSPYGFEVCLRVPTVALSHFVELASVSPSVILLSAEAAVIPHACETLLNQCYSIPLLHIFL